MSEKIAVVTGTSSGIGFATLLKFAKQGFKAYGTVRNLRDKDAIFQAADEAGIPKENIAIVQVDVMDKDCGRVVEEIIAKEGHIDVLVNNAGVGYHGSIESFTTEDLYAQYECNVFGPIRLIQAALPTLRARKSGRIINISSIAGVMSFPFLSLYCSTKYALEGITQGLRLELAPLGVQAILVEPGFTKTNFLKKMENLKGSRKIADDPYVDSCAASKAFMTYGINHGLRPEVVAETIFRAATDEDPPFRYQCSSYDANLVGAILRDPVGISLPPRAAS